MKNQHALVKAAVLIAVLLFIFSGIAQAQFVFTTNNGAITITGYTGNPTNFDIPAAINGYPVTSIGDGALAGDNDLLSVTIPGSVTNIGSGALSYSYTLAHVTLATGLLNIGDGAFNTCHALAGLTIPTTVTNLGALAFFNSGLTSITVPDNVISIGKAAFCSTLLTNAVLPHGLTNLSDELFAACNNLLSVTIPASVTTFGSDVFNSCFRLPSVTIPDGVTSIGSGAFDACESLTNLSIPASVTNLGDYVFHSCAGLGAITVAALNPVYSSRDGILCDKSGTILLQFPLGRRGSYRIPDGITYIKAPAFDAGGETTIPSLTTVTIPGSVTNIDDYAFVRCVDLAGIYFLGNIPAGIGTNPFSREDNATVYYLPGTTGWDSTLSGLPTVLWNPQAQTGDGSFGLQASQFGFNINGNSNMVVVVEACTNLVNPVWLSVKTNMLTNGSAYFSDPQSSNYTRRFYHFRMP